MRQRLSEARSRFYKERAVYGAVVTATVAVGVVCALAILETIFNGNIVFRSLLVLITLCAVASTGVVTVLLPLLRWNSILNGVTEEFLAVRVGEKFPGVRDRLRNLLEIFEEQNESGETQQKFHPTYSPALIDASFDDLQKEASGIRFTDIVSFEAVRRMERLLSFVAVSTIVLFVIPQFGLPFASYRVFHFRTDFRQPDAFSFLVQPGNVEVVKGESVPVSVSLLAGANQFLTDLPKNITLAYRYKGMSSTEQVELKSDSSGSFHYALASLKQTTVYFVQAGGIQSPPFTISVTDRPVVRSIKVHLNPPKYSHLPPQDLDDNIGDVLTLKGTTVAWSIIPSKELRRAEIVFADGKKSMLARHGESYRISQTLRAEEKYHIEMEDEEGFANINPIEYKLDILKDETPTVSIIEPGKNVDIAGETEFPLRMKIHDDFGFSEMKIAYRLTHSRYEQAAEQFSFIAVPLSGESKKATEADIDFAWDLSKIGLVPEDVIEYHAEVFDNDDVSGPKKGVSESFLLRFPSLDEVFADADKNQNDAIQKMDESLKDAEELKKNLDELSQEMKKAQPLDWQEQKKAEETLKRYQDLAKKVDEVSKSVDAMTREMEKNNILSSETLQKYMELQQLMQQINSPEFQEAMKKMQQAMQNVSPDQLRQAMQQVQFSEEAFRQSIERTMELLKRIQVEQKMDEMVKRSTELQEKQEALQKETSETPPGDKEKADELARKQDDINKELAALQKQLEELRKKMEEFPKEMPMKELDKAEQAARDSAMEQSMQESSKQLRSQQKNQASKSQQQASKGLEQMTHRMSEMQEEMLSSQMAETMNALKKAMKDLLEISQEEEALKNESQSLDPNSQQFRENAQRQLGLQSDLSHVTENLVELSQKSFAVTPEMGRSIGKAMGNMSQAMSGLEQRNGQTASSQQGEAMASLNKAAMQVQSSMDAMQQGGEGGGRGSLLQQLRRMAGQQQSINLQTEKLSQGQGSQQQLQEMGRLAKQQDAVRKSLEQLNKEAQESPDRNRLLGDLQRIADEMKEVVQNLQQNNVNPNTIQQQQRILSRMLDAQTSMRERDFEQRRKSTAGKTPVRRSPTETEGESSLTQLRRDLLKAMEEGYSKDYQDLIRKYYDALNGAQKK